MADYRAAASRGVFGVGEKMLRTISAEQRHLLLHKMKKRLFFVQKIIAYCSVSAFWQAIIRKYIRIKGLLGIKKKIIWVGCFAPHASSVGDQAQSLAVEIFLRKHFSDYQVHRFLRNEVGGVRWKKIVSGVKKEDIVMIHSSGDFGSRYRTCYDRCITMKDAHKIGMLTMEYSWHDIRRIIILSFPNNPIIHLPTTVYYEENEKGKETLRQDKKYYENKSITILCREPESHAIIASNFNCKSFFFPDFVFYLKPSLLKIGRKGALLLLRADSESKYTRSGRCAIKEKVKSVVSDVLDENIHKVTFPIIELIRENYINSIFRIYQSRRVVITDMMHGMIFAVINKTPCVALDEAIPHKISAYKDILGKSVAFADSIDMIPACIQEALDKPYRETDMSAYFENFRRDIMGELP